MAAYAKIAQHLLISKIIEGGLPVSGGRDKTDKGFLALSGLFLLTAIGFMVYAAHIYFVSIYAAEVAMLYTGLILFGLSCLSLCLSYMIHRYKMKRIQQVKDEVLKALQDTVSAANDEFGESIREHPKSAALLASLAGYAAGNKLF